ncbi:hypothetical protein H3M12_09280 [Levilactobacillus suantsaii]|uniref:Uncharacterized protein n=1 Tax=Levilactobacillus suantsaii TaxID=2292255 RepID=A0A4Q0VJ03_9LACO|nr:hypothetical protein [Levilactobacillus suantsaii]QMU07651.1 hypothetical protein H3M12_09280 [Levilactobacillus suantsaii]RXI78632.1 hypothetical protein DXH47_06080 [Levilactobacillus suantsaii]
MITNKDFPVIHKFIIKINKNVLANVNVDQAKISANRWKNGQPVGISPKGGPKKWVALTQTGRGLRNLVKFIDSLNPRPYCHKIRQT